MGYFNPIIYFIKSFIRLFTRKFFWVLLILILVFLGFLLYDKGVFAVSNDITALNNIFNSAVDWLHNNGYQYYKYAFLEDKDGPGGGIVFTVRSDGYISVVNYNGQLYNSGSHIIFFWYNSETHPDTYVDMLNQANNTNSAYLPMSSRVYTYGNTDIIYNNGSFYQSTTPLPEPFVNPEITNATNDINGLTFETLDIQLNSADFPTNSLRTLLNVQYTAEDENQFTIDVSKYANASDYSLHIPRIELIKNMVLSTSFNMSLTLLYADTFGNVSSNYNLGSYNISITADYMTTLNELAEKDTQNNIENNTDKTAQGIENINNSITDSNIDDITSDTLPSDDTTDITADGVNGIFNSIYNAFCTGDAQDIVFPIPFTEKSIILSPTYVSDMLSNNGAGFIITLIQAFWWYLISRFIIKDVMSKINKIKSGNIEKIETTNIRGDML